MTLAELKRNASKGNMSLELIERFGKVGEDIPENLRGIRKVVKVNTVGISLMNHDGITSELRFECAKLVEYDGKTLTIYEVGQRKPTSEEQSVRDKWNELEKKYSEENPYGDTYWKMKDYFKNCGYPYMSGFDSLKEKGRFYQCNNGLIRDNQVKGDVILRYLVHVD